MSTHFRVEAIPSNMITYKRSLGLLDSKGRDIGYRVDIYEVTWKVRESIWSGITLEQAQAAAFKRSDKPFGLRTNATRDGFLFGALQPYRYFKTAEERNAALEKYVKGATKRAQAKKPAE